MKKDDVAAVVESFVDAGSVGYLLLSVAVYLLAVALVGDSLLVVAHFVTVVLLLLLLRLLVVVV